MKIPETIKTKMSDYYTFGDHTKIKRLGIQKKKPFSLVTIGKAFKEGECHDDLLDLIDEFYNLKIKKYRNKQTAVEFAIQKLEKFIVKGNQIAVETILEQAKEMEKQQLKEKYNNGYANGQRDLIIS